jgi:hypothetical protein
MAVVSHVRGNVALETVTVVATGYPDEYGFFATADLIDC